MTTIDNLTELSNTQLTKARREARGREDLEAFKAIEAEIKRRKAATAKPEAKPKAKAAAPPTKRKVTVATTLYEEGTRVNAEWTDGNVYPAVVTQKAMSNDKTVAVRWDDGDEGTSVVAKVTPRQSGRRSLEQEHSPEEIAEQIESLLQQLSTSTDIDEKKRIRRALRRRGHWQSKG